MLLHKMQLLSIFYVEEIFFGRYCYLIIISVSSKLVIMKTDKSPLTAHHVYMQSSIAGISHIFKRKKIGSPPQYRVGMSKFIKSTWTVGSTYPERSRICIWCRTINLFPTYLKTPSWDLLFEECFLTLQQQQVEGDLIFIQISKKNIVFNSNKLSTVNNVMCENINYRYSWTYIKPLIRLRFVIIASLPRTI